MESIGSEWHSTMLIHQLIMTALDEESILQFSIVADGKTITLVSTAVTKVANLIKPTYIEIIRWPT